MRHKKIADILTILWVVNLLVGLLIISTHLSLSPYRLIYLQFSFFVSGPPLIIWWNKRTNGTRQFAIWTFIICNSVIAFYYVFIDWRGEWKTQTIEYQNLHLSNRTIEFQLQGKGAMGYNRRHVDRLRILPFIEWTKEVDPKSLDTLTWKKVDTYVNEMELKGG